MAGTPNVSLNVLREKKMQCTDTPPGRKVKSPKGCTHSAYIKTYAYIGNHCPFL